jgi:hypothetical protein
VTPDLIGLIRALCDAHVDFIIVGGVAANLHGALRTTLDLDVVYARLRQSGARGRRSQPTTPTFAARPKVCRSRSTSQRSNAV